MGEHWEDKKIEKPRQVVVCAAIKYDNGLIICGPRHYDRTMVNVITYIGNLPHISEDGFIDQFGTFLTRKEAMIIAIAAGQNVDIERGCGGDTELLYSEGLY
jgi:hypothetical protein